VSNRKQLIDQAANIGGQERLLQQGPSRVGEEALGGVPQSVAGGESDTSAERRTVLCDPKSGYESLVISADQASAWRRAPNLLIRATPGYIGADMNLTPGCGD
jgi:hypothetical protein